MTQETHTDKVPASSQEISIAPPVQEWQLRNWGFARRWGMNPFLVQENFYASFPILHEIPIIKIQQGLQAPR